MTEYDLVVRGGTVVNASEISRCDVGVREGRIVALGENLGTGVHEIDAATRTLLRQSKSKRVRLWSWTPT